MNTYKPGMVFKGADKVIKRLAFESKISPDKKFSVCYEDRFLGILEADLEVFLTNGEIPFHRIQMFKLNGEVVWNRKNKFTTL